MKNKIVLMALAVMVLCGFTEQRSTITLKSSAVSQPPSERQVQDKLPQSHDAMWAVLGKAKITVDAKKGLYSANMPPEVKKLAGTEVKISGFMLPLEATEKFKHFLLSKRTPTCPFCPPGEPNEIVDVWLTKPTAWDDNLITVTGKFELLNNQQAGLFFKLSDAKKN